MVRRALDADLDTWAFAIGDLVPTGTADEYDFGYHPAWGDFLPRTFCVPGNHDRLADPTMTPYYDYVGERGGPRGKGYYAVNLGDYWRVYFMNSERLHAEQSAWLTADLPEWQGKRHIMAAWHTPVFVSICQHNNKAMTNMGKMRPWWRILEAHGAEFVMCGHVHRYERFPRASVGSTVSTQGLVGGVASEKGLRQFVIGTGGAGVMPILTKHPLSQVQVINRGMARFDLYPDRYEWSFTDISGVQRDSGVQLCRLAVV